MRSVRSDSSVRSKARPPPTVSGSGPPKARPVKVAAESLAQRAKHTSEERIGKFRKSLARGHSAEDTAAAKRKSGSPQQHTDSSDKDSLRSTRHSRSSSLSSEVSIKSSSTASRTRSTAVLASNSASKKAGKAAGAASKQLEQQQLPARGKKLFPRNPIQNLIRFYEASTERTAEASCAEDREEVLGDLERTPVVLEDKVKKY